MDPRYVNEVDPRVHVTLTMDRVCADHVSVVVSGRGRVEHGTYTSIDVALVAVNTFVRRILGVPS